MTGIAERDTFLATPRHPRWKDEMITKAHDGLVGALNILFSKSNIGKVALSEVTVEQWRSVQSIVLANEGTLKSEDGRLMGRLDLLVADMDENGISKGWIVADLKTGNPPKQKLNEKVSRQLRFYRDLLKENNVDLDTIPSTRKGGGKPTKKDLITKLLQENIKPPQNWVAEIDSNKMDKSLVADIKKSIFLVD